MDDRRAHFLTMLGDACAAAGVASIAVELMLRDGSRIGGLPSPQPVGAARDLLEETGYANRLLVNGVAIRLEDVEGFAILSP